MPVYFFLEMGCCFSSGREEEARVEELRRWVERLPTKDERENLILHFLTLFEEAKDGSRDEALATLANIIRIVDSTK